MDNKKLMIIVAAVIVIIVAAAAIYVALPSDEPDSPDDNVTPDNPDEEDTGVMKPVDSRLAIYGNANNDQTVDSKDIDLINKIIDRKESRFDWPLADANLDGKVDKTDVEIVKKLIRGEKTEVIVHDQGGKDGDEDLKLDYPVRNIVTINEDMTTFVQCIGGTSSIAGFVASINSYPVMMSGPLNAGAISLQAKVMRGLTADGWENIKKLDSDLHKKGEAIGAILVDRNSSMGEFYDDCVKVGIPLLNIRCTDPDLALDGSLMIGFLLGKETEKGSQEYVAKADEALAYLDEQLKKAPKKVNFIALCMTNAIAQIESQYTKIGIRAGGNPVTNVPGDSSDHIESVEYITQFDGKVDVLLNNKTMDAQVKKPSDYFESRGIQYLEKSAAFNTTTFINLSTPSVCKIIYTAHVMYPDLISMDYADDLLQWNVDKYLTFLHQTQADGYFDVRTDMSRTISWTDWQNENTAPW